MTATQGKTGLEGVIAAETRISGVDGQAGELVIAGFAVEELAQQATFEEVVYLLWHDALAQCRATFGVQAGLGGTQNAATNHAGCAASGGSQKRRSRWMRCEWQPALSAWKRGQQNTTVQTGKP